MDYKEKRRIKKWERKFRWSSGNSERARIMQLEMKYLKRVVVYEVTARTKKGEPVL